MMSVTTSRKLNHTKLKARLQKKLARCRLEETVREQRDSHQSGKHGGCRRGSTGRLQGCGQSGRCKRPTWNRKESCPHDTHRSGERIERSRGIKTCLSFLVFVD